MTFVEKKLKRPHMIIQADPWIMDTTARDDILGLCDQKVHTNMCLMFYVYGVMATWILK